MKTLVHQKNTFSIDFSKTMTKFCLISHYHHNNSYVFVNGKEIFKFKANNKNVNFLTQFSLGSISNRFGAIDFRKEYFKRKRE